MRISSSVYIVRGPALFLNAREETIGPALLILLCRGQREEGACVRLEAATVAPAVGALTENTWAYCDLISSSRRSFSTSRPADLETQAVGMRCRSGHRPQKHFAAQDGVDHATRHFQCARLDAHRAVTTDGRVERLGSRTLEAGGKL